MTPKHILDQALRYGKQFQNLVERRKSADEDRIKDAWFQFAEQLDRQDFANAVNSFMAGRASVMTSFAFHRRNQTQGYISKSK